MAVGEARGRQLVNDRSHGRCEVCAAKDSLQWSHRRARGQGGSWAPSNGCRLCYACHAWVEAQPVLADAGGWRLVHRDVDPATVPVWLNTVNGFGWWLLDDDGGYERAWPEDYDLPDVPELPPGVRLRP